MSEQEVKELDLHGEMLVRREKLAALRAKVNAFPNQFRAWLCGNGRGLRPCRWHPALRQSFPRRIAPAPHAVPSRGHS